MRLKRISALSASFMLGLSSLMVMSLGGVAHANGVTLYWCNENATTADFNTAANWNTDSDCSSGTAEVPVSGDTLIFDDTNLTSPVSINDDINGLDINSITFQGSNTNGDSFLITGDAMSLDAGINESSDGGDEIDNDLTLTANQTFTNNATGGIGLSFGDVSLSDTLNLGTYNLSLTNTNGDLTNFDSILTGSGSVIASGSNDGLFEFSAPSPNYSGNINLEDGNTYMYDPGVFGTANVAVSNGADLYGLFSGSTNDVTNAITVGGTGTSGDEALYFDDDCSSNSNCGNEVVTLSGPINLTADTTIGTSTAVDITGTVSGGYCLSRSTSYNGTLTGNTGTCTAAVTGVATARAKAPGTPDTGSALTSANVVLPLFGGVAVAAGLYTISRKVKFLSAK